MNFWESFLPEPFTRAFSLTLLHSLWQGVLIAFLALIAMILLRRQSAALRYAVLCALLALIPLIFCITFFITYQSPQELALNTGSTIGRGIMLVDPAGSGLSLETASKVQSWYIAFSNVFRHNTHWFFMLWLTGFSFFLLRFAGSWIYIYRLKSYRVADVPVLWNDKLLKLSAEVGVRQVVRLAESALARVPITIGYLKPVILLPVGTLSGVPPQQIDAILLHELAHILRKDYLLNILQSIIELLFFYHPVVWWLSGLIRQEREHICDDIALSIHHDRINYIKALTTMEEMNVKSPALASAWSGTRKKLLHRVKRLTNPLIIKRGLTEGIAASIILVSVILAFSANALNFGMVSGIGTYNDESVEMAITGYAPYDLTGGESPERNISLLPEAIYKQGAPISFEKPDIKSPALSIEITEPDTIIAKSESGKVIVKVYKDTLEDGDEETLKVMVERMDRRVHEWERSREDFEKQMIVVKRDALKSDSLRQVIVVKDGDTMILRASDIEMVHPPRPFRYYSYRDLYDLPDVPEIPDLKDLNNDYDFEFEFDEDQFEQISREKEKQMREMEFQWQEMDRKREQMDRQLKERQIYLYPPAPQGSPEWIAGPPIPPVMKSEKLIRQELRSDGLVMPGKQYVVEFDSKSMYINGVKQPKEVYKKYKRLVESLEVSKLEGEEKYMMVF